MYFFLPLTKYDTRRRGGKNSFLGSQQSCWLTKEWNSARWNSRTYSQIPWLFDHYTIRVRVVSLQQKRRPSVVSLLNRLRTVWKIHNYLASFAENLECHGENHRRWGKLMRREYWKLDSVQCRKHEFDFHFPSIFSPVYRFYKYKINNFSITFHVFYMLRSYFGILCT